MVILLFHHPHGAYQRDDIGTWPMVTPFVRAALSPKWRVVGKTKVQEAAAELITPEKRDELVASRLAEIAERTKAKPDPGLDLLVLTDIDDKHVGEVFHVDTSTATVLLQMTAPYYSNEIEIGVGPAYRVASEKEKQLSELERVKILLAERNQEEGQEVSHESH